MTYEGKLVGYGSDHLLLLIHVRCKFSEGDEDGEPYDKITWMKSLEFEFDARDLSDFLYL